MTRNVRARLTDMIDAIEGIRTASRGIGLAQYRRSRSAASASAHRRGG